MNKLWQIDIDILEQYYKIKTEVEKDYGRKLTKEECDFLFNTIMEKLDVKSLGNTEMSQEEIIKDALDKGYESVLHIDKNSQYSLIKKVKE